LHPLPQPGETGRLPRAGRIVDGRFEACGACGAVAALLIRDILQGLQMRHRPADTYFAGQLLFQAPSGAVVELGAAPDPQAAASTTVVPRTAVLIRHLVCGIRTIDRLPCCPV